MNSLRPDIPLSLQIYKAHTEWNRLRQDYDILDGMYEVLKAREVEKGIKDGMAISRAEHWAKASEWNEAYRADMSQAKHAMLDAQAKHAYLVNLAQEQRDEGFNERFQARL